MPWTLPATLPFGGGGGPPAAEFENLGFELGGDPPGHATAWTPTLVMVGERLAIWGVDVPQIEEESFEREWSTNEEYLFVFDLNADTEPGLFDEDVSEGETFEDFEEGWSTNHAYLFEFGSLVEASFDQALTPETVEDFEEGWSTNQGYHFTLPASSAASFDQALTPEAFEDFEEGWSTNQGYHTTFPASTAASFDSGGTPEAVEDFEETYTELPTTADPATDTLITFPTVHGLLVNQRVSFRLGSSGALPSGIVNLHEYYVKTVPDTTTITITPVLGGATLNIVDAGTATFYMRGDPRRYWIIEVA